MANNTRNTSSTAFNTVQTLLAHFAKRYLDWLKNNHMFYKRGKEGVIVLICNRKKKQSIAHATNKNFIKKNTGL